MEHPIEFHIELESILPTSRTRVWRTAAWHGLLLAGYLTAFMLVVVWGRSVVWWSDATSWYTIDIHDLYRRAEEGLLTPGAFRFAPVIAYAMLPLGRLPWEAFIAAYLVASFAVLYYLDHERWWLFLAFPPVILELLNGNIHLFLAAAIVAGFRWPATWALVLLSKVTPGVGVLWFAFRREWRSLAVALGSTALILVLGTMADQRLWTEWIRSLVVSEGMGDTIVTFAPLHLRLALAVALVWRAARDDRRWLVPVAAVIAMPNIWPHSWAMLTAIVPLRRTSAPPPGLVMREALSS